MTSALIGARTLEQLDNSLCALEKLSFNDKERAELDRITQTDPDIFAAPPKADGRDLR